MSVKSYFFRKNKKNIANLSSTEPAHIMVSVNVKCVRLPGAKF